MLYSVFDFAWGQLGGMTNGVAPEFSGRPPLVQSQMFEVSMAIGNTIVRVSFIQQR